jgi:diguanylate cyclase (GGDEF)-like protein
MSPSLPSANGEEPRRDPAQSVSRDVHSLADLDQTLADNDQTASDSDQTAADNDQAAADTDQAASDHDFMQGGDSGLHDYTRDLRDRSALQRRQSAVARAEAATARDAVADARDLTASERDRAADLRDRALAVRDIASAAEARALTGPEIARREEEQRRTAAADRAAAMEGRARAALDREQAASDREQAARERLQARADREALLHQLAIAETDQLTGTRTRAAGLADLEHEIDRARRATGALVLAYIDVVGLKTVNDLHGHAAGDALLQRVVGGIRRHLRSYDLIIRLGGDEFLCVMSGATIEQVRRRFGDVQAALGAEPDPAEVRVGLAALAPDDSAAVLIERADGALCAPNPGRRR